MRPWKPHQASQRTARVDIFRRRENALLHVPVQNTVRAYCDSCGEIYKLIGNDSLNIKVLKPYLVANIGADHAEFEHTQSKQPLTGLQLLALLQTKADTGDDAYKTIKSIGEDRGQAARATTFKGDPTKIYILNDDFLDTGGNIHVVNNHFIDTRRLEWNPARYLYSEQEIAELDAVMEYYRLNRSYVQSLINECQRPYYFDQDKFKQKLNISKHMESEI